MNTTTNPTIEVDAAFVTKVLTPYRPNCRYLKSVQIESSGASPQYDEWQLLTAVGTFEIDQSCYIDDTGHFNAVEFNICYNQLAYVLLAHLIQHRRLPALSVFTLDTFFDKQLSNFLIANISSSYHAPINPRRFSGEARIVSARNRAKLSILKTECRFYDDLGGTSDGEVKLAVLNP